MNLGQLIRQQRKSKGYTQEQLGELVGVSKMAISKYERNIIDNIERKKMLILSKVLDIPIQAFLNVENVNSVPITKQNFYNEVRDLLDKTENLSEQQKKHIMNTINYVCNDKEK